MAQTANLKKIEKTDRIRSLHIHTCIFCRRRLRSSSTLAQFAGRPPATNRPQKRTTHKCEEFPKKDSEVECKQLLEQRNGTTMPMKKWSALKYATVLSVAHGSKLVRTTAVVLIVIINHIIIVIIVVVASFVLVALFAFLRRLLLLLLALRFRRDLTRLLERKLLEAEKRKGCEGKGHGKRVRAFQSVASGCMET